MTDAKTQEAPGTDRATATIETPTVHDMVRHDLLEFDGADVIHLADTGFDAIQQGGDQ